MTAAHPCQQLIERLGIRYPILQGGMTFGSDGRLVAAVSEAGGLGTLGTFHYRTYDKVMEQVEVIRAATERPWAINVPFFENNFELCEALVRRGGVRMFALGGWCSQDMAALKEEFGLTILVSAFSPTVVRMVAERPLDALIVQGNESGGANSHFTTRQLFELARGIVGESMPIVLAGGQWDGTDLHRALLLGAAGVQLGTRFFFCSDSPLHPSIKERAIHTNTKRPLTTTLTPVNQTLNMRFIQNKAFKKARREGEIEQIFQDKERVFSLSEAFYEEQTKPILIYAGAGVYKLEAMQTAGEVVGEIVSGYAEVSGRSLPSFG